MPRACLEITLLCKWGRCCSPRNPLTQPSSVALSQFLRLRSTTSFLSSAKVGLSCTRKMSCFRVALWVGSSRTCPGVKGGLRGQEMQEAGFLLHVARGTFSKVGSYDVIGCHMNTCVPLRVRAHTHTCAHTLFPPGSKMVPWSSKSWEHWVKMLSKKGP